MGLFGGLALFLFGMEHMSDALDGVLKTRLSKLTGKRFSGALIGPFVTAVVQYSSLTTILVVGFVSASKLNLSESIVTVIVANIGTTSNVLHVNSFHS